MNIKMITIVVAAFASMLVNAKSIDQMFADKEWLELAKTYSFSQITNKLTAANKQQMYDACIVSTNNAVLMFAGKLAASSLAGTRDAVYQASIDSRNWIAAWNAISYELNESSIDEAKQMAIIELAFADSAFKKQYPAFCRRLLLSNKLAYRQDAFAIRIANAALEARDYSTAAALLVCVKPIPLVAFSDDVPNSIAAWREAHRTEIMQNLDTIKFSTLYCQCLARFAAKDMFEKNSSCPTAMQYFIPSLYKGSIYPPFFKTSNGETCAFGKATLEAYIQNETNPDCLLNVIKKKAPDNRVKEFYCAKWTCFETKPAMALDIAIEINDVDKIIDLLLKTTNDLTYEKLGKIIIPLNVVDADYRSNDILKVLKNINSKYTIKLYDDRDNWEPVLSKIRAMIDVRQ